MFVPYKLFRLINYVMDVIKSAVRVFDGSNCNVREWVSKIKLVAKLQKIEDISSFLPLYLEGPAYAIYDQLSDADKLDITKIEAVILTAFEHDRFKAYELFKKRIWKVGESVDVYLADLKQLAKAALVDSLAVIYLAFITGLPSDVSTALRAASELRASNDIGKAVDLARILMASYSAKALLAKSSKQSSCYLCHGNHLTNFCPQSRPGVCWKCNRSGHKFSECLEKRQRSTGVACANSISRSVTTLPTVTIEVSGHGQKNALVDTGCSRTIVSSSLCECSNYNQGHIVTVDGSEVSHGVGDITAIIDGHKLNLKCFVLKEVISEYDIILGMDVVSRLGGCIIDSNQRVTFARSSSTMKDAFVKPPDMNGVPRSLLDFTLSTNIPKEQCGSDLGHPSRKNVKPDGQNFRPYVKVRPPDRWGINTYDA